MSDHRTARRQATAGVTAARDAHLAGDDRLALEHYTMAHKRAVEALHLDGPGAAEVIAPLVEVLAADIERLKADLAELGVDLEGQPS